MELVERTWKHPTGASPKRVALIGLGPSHHDYDQAWLAPQTPDALWQVDEVWTLNRGAFNIRHDCVFVMDHITGEAERHPVYGARLWNHDKPVITSDNSDGWPDHVKNYPFDEIWTWLNTEFSPPPVHIDWIINSVPFILLYAGYIGVQRMYGWGLDYHHHKSGRVEDGHANVAYWVGVLERIGLQVTGPDISTFLDSNARSHFYGYQRDPRPHAVSLRATFRRLAGIDPAPLPEADGENGPVSPQEPL